MTLNSLKDLEKAIKLCRKHGVASIEINGIKMVFTAHTTTAPKKSAFDHTAPEETISVPAYNGDIDPVEPPKTEELTEEQLLYYSAQGHMEPI